MLVYQSVFKGPVFTIQKVTIPAIVALRIHEQMMDQNKTHEFTLVENTENSHHAIVSVSYPPSLAICLTKKQLI